MRRVLIGDDMPIKSSQVKVMAKDVIGDNAMVLAKDMIGDNALKR